MSINQPEKEQNIYLPIIIGFLLFGLFAYLSWVTLPPARRGLAPGEVAEPQPEVAVVAAPVEVESAGDVAAGQALFTATCAACHGPAGQGVQGLGKDMTTSEFIAGLSDEALVAFIKVGRDPSDPLNSTGVAMPARGGNPALSDDDLLAIVAYIRSLQK